MVDPLQQALNTKGCGKYVNCQLREVVKIDLAWIHWLYRKMRAEEATGNLPGKLALNLRLICKHYPMGIDDETEKELKNDTPATITSAPDASLVEQEDPRDDNAHSNVFSESDKAQQRNQELASQVQLSTPLPTS